MIKLWYKYIKNKIQRNFQALFSFTRHSACHLRGYSVTSLAHAYRVAKYWHEAHAHWRHQKFLWGASRGQNAFLRGQKSKNLPKMADFNHFLLLTGWQVGDRASNWGWGENAPMPPLMPPLHTPPLWHKTKQIELTLTLPNGQLPFEIHTPPVEDLSHVFHRGV